MVEQLADMLFAGNPGMLEKIEEPFDTLGKMKAVRCPTLVMHGDKDEIVPYIQAVQCHAACAAEHKVLKTWPGGGHNDIGMNFGSAWGKEVVALLDKAASYKD